MNRFEAAATRAIQQHGVFCVYKRTDNPVYDPLTDTTTQVVTDVSLKAYQKSIVANQYNFPNLVGKEVNEFYILASALTQEPKPQDKIQVGASKYSIVSWQGHGALGDAVLYCVVAVKV